MTTAQLGIAESQPGNIMLGDLGSSILTESPTGVVMFEQNVLIVNDSLDERCIHGVIGSRIRRHTTKARNPVT